MRRCVYSFRASSVISVSALGIASMLVGTAARAQDTPAAQSGSAAKLEEVVVTAQKRSESVQQIPIAITALSEKDLAARNLKTMSDLAGQVPGVLFGDVTNAPQIFVRGVGFNTLTGTGEGAVAVHVDGAYLQHPGSIGMLQRDLARVEVLRGPQGTLYGRNAVGGVINFVTAAPSDEFGGGASASYGNYDAYEVSGFVTGPITDKVRARLYVETDDRDGYIKNLNPELSGQSRYDGLDGHTERLSIDADLTPDTKLSLRLFNREESFTGPIFKPTNPDYVSAVFGLPVDVLEDTITSFHPWKARLDLPAKSDREFYGGTVQLDHDLGEVRFVSVTSWNRYKWDEAVADADGTALPVVRGGPRFDHAETFTQEFNLLRDTDRFNWILGAYYLHDDQNSQNVGLGPNDWLLVSWNRSDQTFQSASVFFDVTYKFTDALSLYGGLRGIYEKTHFRHENYGSFTESIGAPPPRPPGPGWECHYDDGGLGDQKDDRTDLTGRFGAKYELNDRSNVYAQFSRGDKSGVYDNASCSPPSKPENMNAYEIGTKNTWFDGVFQLNMSAYYYDYKDLQIEEIVVPLLYYKNGDARVYGLDAEAAVQASDRWRFNLGANLMSAKYKRYENEDFLNLSLPGYSPETDLDGNYLNRSPTYTINFGAQYDQPLGFATIRLRSDIYASGKYYLRPYNLEGDKQDAYTKIDGSITFIGPNDRWEARAFIKNATNESVMYGMLAFFGQEGVYGAPRTYGGELSFRF